MIQLNIFIVVVVTQGYTCDNIPQICPGPPAYTNECMYNC